MHPTIPVNLRAARIGQNVRAELKREKITQAEAAEWADLSRQAFVQRLSGRHGGLTGAHLDIIALMLGVPVEKFYPKPVGDQAVAS